VPPRGHDKTLVIAHRRILWRVSLVATCVLGKSYPVRLRSCRRTSDSRRAKLCASRDAQSRRFHTSSTDRRTATTVRRNAELRRMDTISRSAVIVTPAKPFLDWLHRVDSTSAELSLEDLKRDVTIYLVPGYDTEEEAHRFLKKYCGEIFEEQLDGWFRVTSAWPLDWSFATFVRWFEYSFHSVIVELCDAPLKRDE
jgi:hypothetical protein